jgi:Caspase domain
VAKCGRQPRTILLLAVVLALAAGAPVSSVAAQRGLQVQSQGKVSWPAKSKRYALVIGVDNYADPEITTLSGASNDARAIANALVAYAGFPKEQVTLLATSEGVAHQPTRNSILKRLYDMIGLIPPDGLLFLSFAGHGMERGNEAFLLPSDAELSNDVRLLEQTAINVTVIKERIRDTGVRQVVMVLDACRNDPEKSRGLKDNLLSEAYMRGFNFDVRNNEVTAFATLYATAVGERAYESQERNQGYFTLELVDGLRGAAANGKGEITLAGLLDYVQNRVPQVVRREEGPGREQRPFAEIAGYRADELVIAFAPTGNRNAQAPAFGTDTQTSIRNVPARTTPVPVTAVPAPAAPAPQTAPAPADPAIEMAYWDAIKNSSNSDAYKAYLTKYPNGEFAELARVRISENRSNTISSVLTAITAAAQTAPGFNQQQQRVASVTQTPTQTQQQRQMVASYIYTLGTFLGVAHFASSQNAAASYVLPYIDGARQIAQQWNIVTQGLDEVGNALRSGATAQSIVPSVSAAFQTISQQLNINANCGRAVNLSAFLNLGYDQGLLEVVGYQNGDPNYFRQVIQYAVAYANASGLPNAGFLEADRQVAAGAATVTQYQPLLAIKAQVQQATNVYCMF